MFFRHKKAVYTLNLLKNYFNLIHNFSKHNPIKNISKSIFILIATFEAMTMYDNTSLK